MNSVWEEPTRCSQKNLKYGQTIKYSATEIDIPLFLMFFKISMEVLIENINGLEGEKMWNV